MNRKYWAILSLVLILLLAGCGVNAPAAQKVATTIPAPTNAPPPTDTLTPTADAAATQSAQQTSGAAAAITQLAEETAAKATEAKDMLRATETAHYSALTTSTAAAKATSTAESGAFLDVIHNLLSEGAINSSDGNLRTLRQFVKEEAMIDYIIYTSTDISAENYVLETNIAWDSASSTANWDHSGCGFVFGLEKKGVYDFVSLRLDGNVRVSRHTASSDWKAFAMKRWGKPELPAGTAKLLLAVYDKRFTIYVNDQKVVSVLDSAYKPGKIYYTVVSGTNKGFGTRCTFSNTKVFILK